MPDPDEMDRLRRADPVDRASLPSPTDPEARALFEEITMTDTDTRTREPETMSGPTRRRQVAIGAIAAAVLLIVAVTALARDDGDDPASRPDQVADAPSTTVAGAPITLGGSFIGSCVERYDLVTLAHREMAFDGTVTGVDGDSVSFTVAKWFRGGSSPTITMQGAEVLGGLTSTGAPTPLAPGTRLLVAGDGGFAWTCGFTQPYDSAVAQEWARVFGG